MGDEFALCWNNFQDNMTTGFQTLYDRGDFVDVTIACDGKLIHAHKTVLAICSPYFQEIFSSNPCNHPIIILKDVPYRVMCELMQFMYHGVVNLKHTELSLFMKIAQSLQIKGLAASTTQKSFRYMQSLSFHNPFVAGKYLQGTRHTTNNSKDTVEGQAHRPTDVANTFGLTNKNDDAIATSSSTSLKRSSESSTTGNERTPSTPSSPRKQAKLRRDFSSIDNMDAEELFTPAIPAISMLGSRFEFDDIKKENDYTSMMDDIEFRPSLAQQCQLGYGIYPRKDANDFVQDEQRKSEAFKSDVSHMDIPSVAPGERWFQGKLEFMLSQRGKPLLVHDGHTFGIQYIRKDKKYWQCNLSRKFNCKARVTTTAGGEIIVTNNEHCHTEIRQHLLKDYHRNKSSSSSTGRSFKSPNSNPDRSGGGIYLGTKIIKSDSGTMDDQDVEKSNPFSPNNKNDEPKDGGNPSERSNV